jgi:hypothetical protein
MRASQRASVAVEHLAMAQRVIALQPQPAPRFVRRTQLAPTEYRRNFHQIDHDVATAISSDEADRVTPLMSKIYMRLVSAPRSYLERDGVLRFEEESAADGTRLTAWVALCKLLGVSSATANKALRWLHDQAIIGYDARKNGAGIRIFLNRASSSIGQRPPSTARQKFFPTSPTSFGDSRTSSNEVPFNDTFGVLDIQDNCSTRAPKNGAHDDVQRTFPFLNLVVTRIQQEIGDGIRSAANQAAQAEHERTRVWLERYGIPKAARVAQNETFKLLGKKPRDTIGRRARASAHDPPLEDSSRPSGNESVRLSEEDVRELAEISLNMLELHRQDIRTTLAQLLGEQGSASEDADRVFRLASTRLGEAKTPEACDTS